MYMYMCTWMLVVPLYNLNSIKVYTTRPVEFVLEVLYIMCVYFCLCRNVHVSHSRLWLVGLLTHEVHTLIFLFRYLVFGKYIASAMYV